MIDELPRIVFALVGVVSASVFLVLAVVTLRRGPRVTYLRWWAAYCLVTCVHLVSIPLSDWVGDLRRPEPSCGHP